jgi:tetratricopeptide (TPR) repeat protein
MARGENRRHLEAQFGAAISFRRLDRREEAADRLREVLQLDASDHQFARYWLAATLFDLERYDELRQLLVRYDEPTALWRYAQSLLAYRLGGDAEDARRLLQEASRLDADFLDYLLGGSLVYADRPVRFGRNRHETTHSLAALFLPAWRATLRIVPDFVTCGREAKTCEIVTNGKQLKMRLSWTFPTRRP